MYRYGLIAVIAQTFHLNFLNTIPNPRFVLVVECSASSIVSAEDYFEGFRHQLQNIELENTEKIVATQIMRLEN